MTVPSLGSAISGAASARPVATSSVAGMLGGPMIAWAAVQFAGIQLSEDCAAQVSLLLLYGATAAGGLVAGLVQWVLRRRAA